MQALRLRLAESSSLGAAPDPVPERWSHFGRFGTAPISRAVSVGRSRHVFTQHISHCPLKEKHPCPSMRSSKDRLERRRAPDQGDMRKCCCNLKCWRPPQESDGAWLQVWLLPARDSDSTRVAARVRVAAAGTVGQWASGGRCREWPGPRAADGGASGGRRRTRIGSGRGVPVRW
jgi:hypothetical protein